MKKTGVFYGSTTGTTESVARTIAEKLGIPSSDVYNVSKMTADVAGSYEALILGTSTWGDGELQDDWYDGIKVLKEWTSPARRLPCSDAVILNLTPIRSATAWVSCSKT